MSEKTENQSNALDMFKWVVVFALLAGLVTANTMYGEISVLYRAIAIVVVVGVAGFIAATTEKGSTFFTLLKSLAQKFARLCGQLAKRRTKLHLSCLQRR